VVLRFGRATLPPRHLTRARASWDHARLALNRANEALNRVVATGEWGTVIPKGDLSQLGRHRCSLLSQFAGVEHQPNLGVGVDPVRVEWLVAAADGAL
jgi:hypothetical protein